MSNSHVAPSSELSVSHAVARPARAIATAVGCFFVSLRAASEAARAFERLSAMSDAELAARGLDRDTLARHIVEKHLTF